jgi:translocator protein
VVSDHRHSVFGPVWTTLYVLMGIAAWLVWTTAGFRTARTALMLFALQLLLNGAWSWLFFGLHEPGWAFLDIVGLWIAIAATTVAFFGHRQTAGWLLMPYLAWVSFAGMLNFAIWTLNTT